MVRENRWTRRQVLGQGALTLAVPLASGRENAVVSTPDLPPTNHRIGTATARPNSDTIRIGIVLPGTDSLSAERSSIQRSIEVAVEGWNDRSGDDAPAETVLAESSSGGTGVAGAIDRLVDEGVHVVVNGTQAATNERVVEALRSHGVPQFDVFGAGAPLPADGWTYRVQPNVAKQAQDFVRNATMIFERAGESIETIGFAHQDDDAAFRLVAQIVRNGVAVSNPRISFEPTLRTAVSSADASLSEQAAELRDAEPDVVCLVTRRPTGAELFDAFAEIGYDPEYVIATGERVDYDPDPAPSQWMRIDGNLLGIGPFENPADPRTEAVRERFAAMGETSLPSSAAVQSFDPVAYQTTITAATAVSVAGVDGKSIDDVLQSHTFDSGILAMRAIEFGPAGENRHASSVTVQVQSLVPRIIYPQAYVETTPNAPLYFIDKEPPVIGGEEPTPDAEPNATAERRR